MRWFGKKKKEEENTSPKFSAEEEKVIDTIMTAQAPIDVRQAVAMIDSLVQTQMSNLVLQLQVHRLISESDIWEGVESSLRNPEHKHMFALIADLPSQMKAEQTQSGLSFDNDTVMSLLQFAGDAVADEDEPYLVVIFTDGEDFAAYGANLSIPSEGIEIGPDTIEGLEKVIVDFIDGYRQANNNSPTEAVLVLHYPELSEGLVLSTNLYSVFNDAGIRSQAGIVRAGSQVTVVHHE